MPKLNRRQTKSRNNHRRRTRYQRHLRLTPTRHRQQHKTHQNSAQQQAVGIKMMPKWSPPRRIVIHRTSHILPMTRPHMSRGRIPQSNPRLIRRTPIRRISSSPSDQRRTRSHSPLIQTEPRTPGEPKRQNNRRPDQRTRQLGSRGKAHKDAHSNHPTPPLTRATAIEYGRLGIRCNAICPGVVETPMFESVLGIGLTTRDEIAAKHAIGRTIQPSEIADLVLFLGSDESTAITGQAITIDGGLLCEVNLTGVPPLG